MLNTPEWAKWKHVPEVTLLEGVALSLNIDPSEIGAHYMLDHSEKLSDPYGSPISGGNGSEGARRLFVAQKNLALNLLLKPTGNTGLHGEPHVSLPQFAVWARSQEWTMPEELAEIASDSSTPKTEKQLLRRERDNLHHIIGALYEVIEGTAPGMEKHPTFKNQTALIEYLEKQYDGIGGMSARNLQRILPAAKKSVH